MPSLIDTSKQASDAQVATAPEESEEASPELEPAESLPISTEGTDTAPPPPDIIALAHFLHDNARGGDPMADALAGKNGENTVSSPPLPDGSDSALENRRFLGAEPRLAEPKSGGGGNATADLENQRFLGTAPPTTTPATNAAFSPATNAAFSPATNAAFSPADSSPSLPAQNAAILPDGSPNRDYYMAKVPSPVPFAAPTPPPTAPVRDSQGEAGRNLIGGAAVALLARALGGDAATAGFGAGAFARSAHGAQDEAFNSKLADYDRSRDNVAAGNALARQGVTDANAQVGAQRDAAQQGYDDANDAYQFGKGLQEKSDLADAANATRQGVADTRADAVKSVADTRADSAVQKTFEGNMLNRMKYIAQQAPDAQAVLAKQFNADAVKSGSGYTMPVPGEKDAEGNVVPALTPDAVSVDKLAHAGLNTARAAELPRLTGIKEKQLGINQQNADTAQGRAKSIADYNTAKITLGQAANEIRRMNVGVGQQRVDMMREVANIRTSGAAKPENVANLLKISQIAQNDTAHIMEQVERAKPKARFDPLTRTYTPPQQSDIDEWNEYAARMGALLDQKRDMVNRIDGIIGSLPQSRAEMIGAGVPGMPNVPIGGGGYGVGSAAPQVGGIAKNGLPPLNGASGGSGVLSNPPRLGTARLFPPGALSSAAQQQWLKTGKYPAKLNTGRSAPPPSVAATGSDSASPVTLPFNPFSANGATLTPIVGGTSAATPLPQVQTGTAAATGKAATKTAHTAPLGNVALPQAQIDKLSNSDYTDYMKRRFASKAGTK